MVVESTCHPGTHRPQALMHQGLEQMRLAPLPHLRPGRGSSLLRQQEQSQAKEESLRLAIPTTMNLSATIVRLPPHGWSVVSSV